MASDPTNKLVSRGEGYDMPQTSLLEGFSSRADLAEGVSLSDLKPRTKIILRTRNSQYIITVLDPLTRHIRLEGGGFFAVPTEAVLWGASFGGSFLKAGWIGIGFRMEVELRRADGQSQTIVTSPVDALMLESAL